MIVREEPAVVAADATINVRITPLGQFALTPAGRRAPIPHVLGRFRVLGEIGRGGMGVVLRAYDPHMDRELAVKVLAPDIAPDSEAGRRFAQEARVAGRLDHPGIVPIYEAGSLADGRSYFTMPVLDGNTLAAAFADRSHPRDDLDRWSAVFDRLATAVGYAHRKGIVHRDLKPANVMLGPAGQAVVMDWGVAAMRESRTERDDAGGCWVFGTPAYMAPEQARGSCAADPRGDVFGLGAILCELLTGQPPYVGADPTTVTRQAAAGDLDDAYGRLAESSADFVLIDLACECLSVDPVDRPADADEVADRVGDYLRTIAGRGAQRRTA
jgi:serine/threonine-protein kinase